MVESQPASTLPPTLLARPPTPPRESNQNNTKSSLVDRFFRSSSSRRSSAPASSAFTPDSSAESPTTSGSSRKKVGFSDLAQYKDPPTVSFDGKGLLKHAVQPLPPSAERKPSKSILKAHNGNQEHEWLSIDGGNTTLLPLHHYATFAKMLESIVQQLAGNDRSSKVDAYLMLCGSLKASDNVPDLKALKERMGLLCQYIERDLAQKLDNGKPDSSLIVNALTLLGCFLHKSTIADSLPVDFTIRFVEYAIKVFEDGSMSKEVTKHLMFMLSQQSFSSRVMNQERVGKLLSALHTLDDKVKGKSIVQNRLQICRTLLRQSRNHMLTHTIWIEDLLTDMLSTLKDTRSIAITVGLEASYSLGIEYNASRAVQNILKQEHADGRRFVDYYIERLKASSKGKEDSSAVPQIWSVIILFFRSKPQLLEQWPFFSQFLGILQGCFNVADNSTRTEAHYAWNRLIFAVRPNEKTSPKLRAMLIQALSSQLKRKSSSGRKRTLSSIYTLLYYTLSPVATSAELDLFWDEYLVPLVEDCLVPTKKELTVSEMSKIDATEACVILQSLFDTKTPRKWSETRAMDNLTNNGMEVKELMALDSKWLRRNHVRVFSLLNPLLQKLYWDIGEDSSITRLWQSYIGSIASPAVMEVKVSFDTMSCIASIFGTIHKLWGGGLDILGGLSMTVPSNKQVAFWKGLETILTTSIQGLGILPFTDKTLSIKHDNFIAVATPSQQPTKIRLETKSPLHHLISLLSHSSPALAFDQVFLQMVHNILLPFFEKKLSKQTQIEFVKELTLSLPTEAVLSVKALWQALADFAVTAVDTREKTEPGASSEIPLGTNYRYVVNILETGILLSPQRPLSRWKVLFDALIVSAALDAGDSGKAIAVLEPLAKTLKSRGSSSETGCFGLPYLTHLLGKAAYPKDRQALDAAERKLWGSKQSSAKMISYDPYNDLYAYIQSSLESSYKSFAKLQVPDYADFILALTSLLGRCPIQAVDAALANIQSGIALWIADLDSKLTGGNNLGTAIISLWGMICRLISSLCQTGTHSRVLRHFEILICAGLESRHKTIVNSAITMWNSTFGACKSDLEYPQKAKDALLKLHPIVELQLPCFPESLETDAPSTGHRQHTSSIHHQAESSQYAGLSSIDSGYLAPPGPRAVLKARQSTPQVLITSRRSGSLKRSREETPETGRRNSKKRDITPRVRHDDSQVQFEAIPSSSPGFERVVDSQLLTEKQKEVKERQKADAAMFPDLRSSPRPRGRLPESEDVELDLPIHRSSSKIREMISRGTERETTPTAVIPSDDDNGYVVSSPTPTRSLRARPEDPPSSPPLSPEAAAKSKVHVLEEQISSSPPEGTPEPTSPIDTIEPVAASADVVMENNIQEPPPAVHTEASDLADDITEDILMDTTEANIEEDNLMLSLKAKSDAEDDISSDAVIDQAEIDADENNSTPGANGKVLVGEDDNSESLDPSAQVDPDAMEIKYTVSTNDISINERDSSPAEDPSDQLRASQLEHEAALATAAAQDSDPKVTHQSIITKPSSDSVPSLITELAIGPVYDPETPSTPIRVGDETELQSPKTPQFVDALSSPSGSEKHEVFEDAVSTPRLNIGNATKAPASSSPLSDMDESSMLRIVAEYDQSSSRHVSFLEDKENQPRRTRSSLSKVHPETSSPTSSPAAPVRKSALRKKSGLQHSSQVEKELSSEIDQLETSSLPSLIPETPATKAVVSLTANDLAAPRYFDDDGVEINMDETIIVDTSILEREGRLRTHKKSPRKKSRKRKLFEEPASTSGRASSQGGDADDDVHSQSQIRTTMSPVVAEIVSPSKSTTSAAKKRRGRPPKASQGSVEAENSQEINASQSFTSTDGDASMVETDTSLMDGKSILEEPGMEEMPLVSEDVVQGTAKSINDASLMAQTEMEEDIVMDTILPESTDEMDFIAETTFGDTSSAAKPDSLQQEPDVESNEEIVIKTVTNLLPKANVPQEVMANATASSSPAAVHGTPLGSELKGLEPENADEKVGSQERELNVEEAIDSNAQQSAVEVGSTHDEQPSVSMQSMKDKLQSLITDLRTAALNRQEIRELEDMFMDAKRALYDVELRGRQTADM